MHGVCLVHNEMAFHANAIRSRTLRQQFPNRKAKVLYSWFQTSCRLILRSPDGKGSPHVVIHPSSSTQVQRDGYFTNEDILAQVAAAIIVDILQKNYPHDDQFFIFDDAPTHLKQGDTAISARNAFEYPQTRQELAGTDSLPRRVQEKVLWTQGKKLTKKVQIDPGVLAGGMFDWPSQT